MKFTEITFDVPLREYEYDKAKRFLTEIFQDGKPKYASEVIREASKKQITEKTLMRARIELGIQTRKEIQIPGRWIWCPNFALFFAISTL